MDYVNCLPDETGMEEVDLLMRLRHRSQYWIGDPPGKSVRMRPRTTCVSLVT